MKATISRTGKVGETEVSKGKVVSKDVKGKGKARAISIPPIATRRNEESDEDMYVDPTAVRAAAVHEGSIDLEDTSGGGKLVPFCERR